MSEPNPNSTLAADLSQKFEFYAVGLTFGVLALSVQTATFAGPVAARASELAGWLLLFVSGLVGLSRLEGMPHVYYLEGLKGDAESRSYELKVAAEKGTQVVHVASERQNRPVEELIKQTDRDVLAVADRLKEIDRRTVWRYKVQRAAFVLGLVALVVARGLSPLLGVLREL